MKNEIRCQAKNTKEKSTLTILLMDRSRPPGRPFRTRGKQVRKPKELEGALRRVQDSGKPEVVDVIIYQDMFIHSKAPVHK